MQRSKIFLIGLGVVLALFKWWVICIFLLIFIFRYIFLIFKEEKKLSGVFPQEYPEYCRRVPRIFPSLKALLKRDILEYLPLKLNWIKKEMGSILALLLVTLSIDLWLDIKKKEMSAYFYEAVWIGAVIILFICLAIYLIRWTHEVMRDGSSKS